MTEIGAPSSENDALRARHYDEAKSQGLLLVRIDPKKIRATKFKNRDDRSLLLHDPAFIKLTKNLAAHGQETPIRVRPVKDAPPIEFEIVSGHRRHAACLALVRAHRTVAYQGASGPLPLGADGTPARATIGIYQFGATGTYPPTGVDYVAGTVSLPGP